MQGVEMLWDVKHALSQQFYEAFCASGGGTHADYRRTQEQVVYWRNVYRKVVHELLMQSAIYFDLLHDEWVHLRHVIH